MGSTDGLDSQVAIWLLFVRSDDDPFTVVEQFAICGFFLDISRCLIRLPRFRPRLSWLTSVQVEDSQGEMPMLDFQDHRG